jgi:GNAT superfamily N-acetyltransferase
MTAMITVRAGSPEDVSHGLRLLDDAVVWLATQGRTGQWGSDPLSQIPEFVSRMNGEFEHNDVWLAEIDGSVVGVMLLGREPMPYVAPVDEPELYLRLLVTDRTRIGSGIGQALVDRAVAEARSRGIDLVRVDCYAGDDRKLVSAYERMGFTPTEPFSVKSRGADWPGQVLAIRLSDHALGI